MIFTAFLLLLLATSSHAAIGDFPSDSFDKPIVDILNQTLYGQCLVPMICLDRGQSCGVETDHHVTVNCSNRMAGPYIPYFQTYFLPRRTWDFDFSNNYIEQLQSLSFIAPINVSVNLTRIDLSHNYIFSIAPTTFRGEVSKMLHTVDLSFNKLEDIEEGVFADMPALITLDLSNNKLVNLDSTCKTPFPSLMSLNAEGNKLAKVTFNCLSTADKTVTLQLDKNYITSVDDCSYSDKLNVKFGQNPIICGCSTKFTNSDCLQMDTKTNTSVIETQPRCESAACEVISYNKSYELVDGKKATYVVTVKFSGNAEYTVDVIQYRKADEILSPQVFQSKSQVTGMMKTATLSYNDEYSVCATRTSDTGFAQRSCEYLTPPRYYIGAARQLSASVLFLITAMLLVHC
ncbi:uncharacterized protein [Watersipora subatra]|uniref:uncharacterized protein n=1 Tax=Watersipora subatra TaxID=2589382 RepID=UPI00355C8F5B